MVFVLLLHVGDDVQRARNAAICTEGLVLNKTRDRSGKEAGKAEVMLPNCCEMVYGRLAAP